MSDEAEVTIGRPLGFMGYQDTPDDWDVRNNITNLTHEKCFDRLAFAHPSGCECTVSIALPKHRSRNPLDELNVVVRYGTDSPEHNRFIAAAEQECRGYIEETIKV
jgi:hypothetical protein